MDTTKITDFSELRRENERKFGESFFGTSYSQKSVGGRILRIITISTGDSCVPALLFTSRRLGDFLANGVGVFRAFGLTAQVTGQVFGLFDGIEASLLDLVGI